MAQVISTSTGYKVLFTEPTAYTGLGSVTTFFENVNTEGVWYAMTGQHFGEWVLDFIQSAHHLLIELSDVLIIGSMFILLMVMFGSNRSKKWLYWSVIFFIIIRISGVIF